MAKKRANGEGSIRKRKDGHFRLLKMGQIWMKIFRKLGTLPAPARPGFQPVRPTENRRQYREDTAAAHVFHRDCFFLGPLGLEVGLRFTPFRK